MAAATTSSPKTSPQRPKGLLEVTISDGPFVAGGDELEEQVRGFGFERDVADLVDDEQRVAAEPDELGLQPAGVVGVGEPGDPLGGGGEQDPVPGLAGPDRQPDREVGLAGAGRAEEHHVVLGGDEVQGAQVRDEVAFEAAGVVEVELLQRLAGREPGGADAAFAAVGLAGGDLALQAGDQELLMGPGLGAGPLGQPGHRLAQGRRLQRPGQERDLGGQVPARRSCAAITPPRLVEAERGVVVGQAALLDLGLGGRAAATSIRSRRSALAAATWSGRRWSGAWPRSARGRRPTCPSQSTRTRSRSAMTSIRRPITAGCTE